MAKMTRAISVVVVLCALILGVGWYYFEPHGEFHIYYVSDDELVNPGLTEESIVTGAQYAFGTSSDVLAEYFASFVQSNSTAAYETRRKHQPTVQAKILRNDDQRELYLGGSTTCPFLVFDAERAICDGDTYNILKEHIRDLVSSLAIDEYWIWKLRRG